MSKRDTRTLVEDAIKVGVETARKLRATGHEFTADYEGLAIAQDAVDAYVKSTAKQLDPDIRNWYYFPIEMPIDKFGVGPATVGPNGNAVEIKYEVWDQTATTYGQFNSLPDAINHAMKLELEHLNGKDPT